MPVYNKRGILLLPKVIVLNPKDGNVIAIKIAVTVKIRWDGQDRGKIEFRLRPLIIN